LHDRFGLPSGVRRTIALATMRSPERGRPSPTSGTSPKEWRAPDLAEVTGNRGGNVVLPIRGVERRRISARNGLLVPFNVGMALKGEVDSGVRRL